MKALLYVLPMYRLVALSTFRTKTAYRFNFVVSLVLQMCMYFAELAAVILIVSRVHEIGGWTIYDLMFLYGLVHTSAGVYRVFASELKNFDKYLINGELDALLVRPIPVLLAVMGRSFNIEDMGQGVQGLVVLLYAWNRLQGTVPFTAMNIGLSFLAVFSGSLIWFGIVLSVATIGFWTKRIDDLQPVFLYGPETAMQYPLSIYPKAVQSVFFSILPIAFGSYLPASAILHLGVPTWVVYAGVLVAIVAVFLSLLFWRFGIRHYTSTGT